MKTTARRTDRRVAKRQAVSPKAGKTPRVFLLLSGLLVLYIALPLIGFLPRLSGRTFSSLGQREVLGAVAVSLETATISVLLLALMGIPLAYLLARREFRGKRLINLLVQLPLAVPPVVSGVLLLMVFGPYTPVGGWLGHLGITLTEGKVAIVLAQSFVASPFLIVSARDAFESVDPALEQVGATLGKSPWQVFWHITLPLAWPGIRSGLALSWVRALGEFGATCIVAYHPYTLSVLTWVKFSGSGLTGTLPLVFLQFAVGAGGLAASMLLARRYVARRAAQARSAADPTTDLASYAAARAGAVTARGPRFRPAACNRTHPTQLAVRIRHRVGSFDLDMKFSSSRRRIAILGPSGSGKSLMLKSLAGLLHPTSGQITVAGRVMFSAADALYVPAEQRRVGYVPQNFALFPHKTVIENVLFATAEHRWADSRHALEVLRFLGLEDLVQRYPAQLSYGQQQRVALARALMRDPDYLLLDEPFASLDTPMRLHLRRELLRILRELELPVVLVTHDPDEAYELAEEVVVVNAGQVLQHGPRAEVYNQPSCARVAELLGIRNMFRGQVVATSSSETVIDWQSIQVHAPPSLLPAGASVDFFVRSQGLSLLDPRDTRELGPGAIIEATIDAMWPRATGVRVIAAIGSGPERAYWEIDHGHQDGIGDAWKEGDAVRVFVPLKAVHLPTPP